MTDRDPTLDEIVSAHLDGEATAEEAARIDEDPELQARLATFTAVQSALREEPVTALDDATRDALLARVIGTTIAPPTVVPLRRRASATPRILAVAAGIIAVAFLGIAVALVADDRNGSDDSASTARDESAEAATTLAGSAATTTGGADEYLGAFDDQAGLLAAVDQRTKSFSPPSDDAGGNAAPEASDAAAEARSEADRVASACATGDAQVYRADLSGQAVLVLVDDTTVTVLSLTDCTALTSIPR